MSNSINKKTVVRMKNYCKRVMAEEKETCSFGMK